nr:ABC transporter ATP-binding protein [uncultured Bacillus sp.]
MIVFDCVSKKYGRDIALNQVTFKLESGKIIGLLGPNGSGKSTTLKLIAGLVHSSSGTVRVNGKKAGRRIANEVVYLSELDMFYEPFTIKDMVRYTQSQFPDFDRGRAEELLTFMSLDPSKKMKQLSKGHRSRLKLALALARKAPVILLDEPFSGLDPIVRESIVKGLISFVDFDHQTVVIATHEIAEIEPLLDEVLLVKDGVMVGQRDVEQLRAEEGLSVLEWMKKTFKE